MSSRPTRRAAARRKVVVESSDEETKVESDAEVEEAQYTPSPPPPPKRTRRSTASAAPTQTTPTKKSRRRSRASGDEAETTPKRAPKAKRIKKNASSDKTETELPPPPPKMVIEEPVAEQEAEQEAEEGEQADVDLEPTDRKRTPPRSPMKDIVLGQPSPHRSKTPKQRPAPLDRRISLLDDDLQEISSPRSRRGTPLRGTPKRELGPQTPVLDLTQKINVISTPPTLARPPPKFSQSNPPMSQPQIAIRQRKFEMPSQAIENEGPKQRTVIVKLVLVNFKSYAGRQEVGPFHPSFTSVVGPNGSGKSNVIDSLLFVFGFRASKMRQGKVSALIHNSGAFPDVQSCEVEVHFQEVIDLPNGDYEVVPDSTLIITRRAFKNNSSIYTINGKNSTFTEVTTLLRDRGVDLDHKRFLILQGEVESIAQMKPKAQNDNDDGLLEYLEDIIGTAKYKQPIEESAQEAESLNEVCVEKSNRVQIVEKEKNSLEDKKNIALSFIKDENELAHKQSLLYQLYMHECTNNNNLTAETITQIQAQLDEELEKHQGNEDDIKKLQKKYDSEVKEIEALDKETQLVLKELSRYDKDSVKLQEKEKFLTGKQKKLQKSLDTNNHQVAEAETQIEKSTADVERITGEISELEARLKSEEAEYAKVRDELKDKTQVFSDKITVKQKSLEPFNEKINTKKSQIAVTQSELDILSEKGNAGKNALEEIRAKIKTIKQTGKTKEAEFEACQEEIAQVQTTIAKIGRALEKLSAKEPVIRENLSGARTKAEEAKASFAQSQNQGSVLAGLMRLKESGRVEGFHGRLGHLGTIDQQYDVAISTACPQLDNMVVDTVEVGQHCIEHLRKNNLGRAMFICLDRLPNRHLGSIDTPENAPRLFDLVRPREARFAPAFYSVLRDTLVAKDMQQANRIAYGAKRWRVVTLDGQLIDKSGTMSGGGTRVARGAMSSRPVQQTSKEAVQRLENEREQCESTWQEFLKQRQELEKALKENNDRLPMLETQLAKINLEIESAAHNLTDAQKRAQDLMQELSKEVADDGQATALKNKIKQIQDEIDEVAYQKSSIEEEIEALQEKIMQVGGIRLRTQKTKVDDLKEQLEQLNTEVNAAEISRSKAEKNLAKAKKALVTCEKDLNNVSVELESLADEKKEHELASQESRDKAKESEAFLEKKRDEIAALKEELDEATAELNRTRAVEIEIRNRLEENQKVLAENQKRYTYWKEKWSKLTLHSLKDLNIGAPRAVKPKKKKVKKAKKQRVDSEDEDMGSASGSGSEEEGSDEESEAEDEEDFPVTQPGQEDQDVDMVQVKNEGEDDEEEPGLTEYTADELEDVDKEDLKTEIALLEEKVQNVSVDLSVLSEYRRRAAEHAARAADLDAAVKHRDTVKTRCDELRKRRLEEFMEGFSQISLRLKEMYQMITMGGNAELELVDSLDPFSEGILFSVMPPKKSWKNISNLSGGEKTLSSLALVFALHHYKPTPLYVMDEIDAALDFRNVSIVASYIKERTKNAQFVVISLRNNMFELARRLVGVYKVNHMTKSVTVENQDYIIRPTPVKPAPPPSTQQAIQASQAQIKG